MPQIVQLMWDIKPKIKNHAVIYNGLNYDHHFILGDLAEDTKWK